MPTINDQSAEAPSPATEGAHVLIVEDDAGLQRLLRRALERVGMLVRTAGTGAEALDQDLSWPQLMLLDYSLPDMTGEELVRELKARQAPIPFVVTTGRGDERTAVQMMKLGARDYMVKDSGLLEVLPHVVERELHSLHTRRELERAQTELERQRLLSVRSDRLRSLGQLSACIAHELNQPLAGVRGLAECLLLKLEKNDEMPRETLRERLVLIIEQADRMTQIIEHTRRFALSSKRRERQPVSLNAIIQSGADMTRLCSEISETEVVLELDDSLPPVFGNDYALEEVVINLITNAAHALQKRLRSEPEFSVEKRSVQIKSFQRGTAPDRMVVMQAKDYGGGIPPDVAPHVFTAFFTTKDIDKGTGLGLPICRAILEEHGGTIRFSIQDGERTTFEVELPAWKGEDAPK